MPSLPTVSVILATWRRDESLRLVLGDLARQEGVKAEVVVIDQNQPVTAATVFAEFRSSPHQLTVLPHAPGVVASRNDGAKIASGEVLVFIDDDVRIDSPRYLEIIARNFADPQLDAICGQELSPPHYRSSDTEQGPFDSAFEEACFFYRATTQRREVFHLATCNCAIRRSAWEKIGGLDPIFAGNSYGDDYDLALRMRAAGMKIVFDPEASVRHTRAAMGGLRLDDPCNPWSEADRYVSLWVFYLRHVTPKWRRWYLRDAIVGKSILLRRNFTRPWRWPSIMAGLLIAYRRARRAALTPP
ncbi:MAG: glycosyltransferase [Chthoniobacteraceae bacterium]